MRLATPRSTPRDDPNHHYLWVIVGMLYVSQGSAGELRGDAEGGRWRGVQSVLRCRGGGGGPRMGDDAVAAESLYRKNQPQWKLKPRRSLTHHAHSRAYQSPMFSISLLIFPRPPLSFISLLSPALRRFYPISFVTFVFSSSSRPLAPITQQFHRLLHSILGSTQLQRNRRAILGDKVTS